MSIGNTSPCRSAPQSPSTQILSPQVSPNWTTPQHWMKETCAFSYLNDESQLFQHHPLASSHYPSKYLTLSGFETEDYFERYSVSTLSPFMITYSEVFSILIHLVVSTFSSCFSTFTVAEGIEQPIYIRAKTKPVTNVNTWKRLVHLLVGE